MFSTKQTCVLYALDQGFPLADRENRDWGCSRTGYWVEFGLESGWRSYLTARCHNPEHQHACSENFTSRNLYKDFTSHFADVEGAKYKFKTVFRQCRSLLAMWLCAECIVTVRQLAGCCFRSKVEQQGGRAVGIVHKNTNWRRKKLARGVAGVWWKSRWTQTWWMLRMNGRRWDTEGEAEKRCDGTTGCCRNMNIELHREEKEGVTVWK